MGRIGSAKGQLSDFQISDGFLGWSTFPVQGWQRPCWRCWRSPAHALEVGEAQGIQVRRLWRERGWFDIWPENKSCLYSLSSSMAACNCHTTLGVLHSSTTIHVFSCHLWVISRWRAATTAGGLGPLLGPGWIGSWVYFAQTHWDSGHFAEVWPSFNESLLINVIALVLKSRRLGP